MLLLSILFDTDVFYLKVICTMRLKNNFNEQQCIFLVELLGDKYCPDKLLSMPPK